MASRSGRSIFGLDEFGLDDRLRLFGYVTAENRLAHVWVLRAFDAARSNYHVLLHTTDVAAALAKLAEANPTPLTARVSEIFVTENPAVLRVASVLGAAAPAMICTRACHRPPPTGY